MLEVNNYDLLTPSAISPMLSFIDQHDLNLNEPADLIALALNPCEQRLCRLPYATDYRPGQQRLSSMPFTSAWLTHGGYIACLAALTLWPHQLTHC